MSLRRLMRLIPAIIGGSLIFMAGVGPDEAVSNLSSWLGKVINPPLWIKAESVDTWVLSFASFLLIGSLIWFFWPLITGLRRKLTQENKLLEPASTTIPPPIHSRWSWEPLTQPEIDRLYEHLRPHNQCSVHIACNKSECESLADSLQQLFNRLGWTSFIGDGLFDAVGASGLLINPDDRTAHILKEAIEANTALRVDINPYPRPSGDITPTMLIIGTKKSS